MQKNDILLESGINELELLVFLLRDQPFCVNVAKVQAIVQYDASNVTELPDSPNAMLPKFPCYCNEVGGEMPNSV